MAYPSHIKDALAKALLDTPNIAKRIAEFCINEFPSETLMQLYASDAIVRDAVSPFKAAIGEIWVATSPEFSCTHRFLLIEIEAFCVILAHIGDGHVYGRIYVSNVKAITRDEFSELIRNSGIPDIVYWCKEADGRDAFSLCT